MAPHRNISPGHVVIHPNRDKVICKVTKLIVVAILLASAALVLVVTIGGWSKLQGMKPVDFIWAFLYVALAIFVARWARGLLPIAAGLAILLLIIAVIAALGLAGTSWSARAHSDFAHAQSLLGGQGLGDHTLSAVTMLLIPVEAALIVFAMIGFIQGWNVETEIPEEEARKRGIKTIASGPQQAAAG